MTILLVTNGGVPGPLILEKPWAANRIESVDMYDFEQVEWRRHQALWLTMHSDQRLLQRLGGRLDRYLSEGGRVVFCGHVAWPFLPELATFIPLRQYRVDDLRVQMVHPHPVWAGIDPEHLTFRRGVAGFYGRGHNPPPEGARILNTIGGGTAPLDWSLDWRGGGTLLVHAGNNLWGYLDEHGTADRLPSALMEWSLG